MRFYQKQKHKKQFYIYSHGNQLVLNCPAQVKRHLMNHYVAIAKTVESVYTLQGSVNWNEIHVLQNSLRK